MIFLLNHLLERSARDRPDHVAVSDRGRTITYGELDARSNQLANLLLDLGVRKGDRVGLYLDKSLESVLAIYGVLKTGAVYVPLDPQAPPKRLGYIVRDAGIDCLLSGSEKSALWGDLISECGGLGSIIVLNDDHPGIEEEASTARLLGKLDIDASEASLPEIRPMHLELAYILYTSGSTGEPKGVMLSHLNALTFVDWAVDALDVGAGDRLSNHAPLHFDLSIFDVFGAAQAGATLVLVPPETSVFPLEVARFIDHNEITIWYSVPSILSLMIQRGKLKPDAFPHLRHLVFAGEVFPIKYLRRLMGLLPHVAFHNWYGPTETNVCTYHVVGPIPEEQTEPIPIGRPIANVETLVVTDDGQRAGEGEVGELYVRGSTVMRGYWADPERTAERLVPHPFADVPGLVYRTGDLVRTRPDGNYDFLGRRDAQIKSRGYRIDLGDIETALYAHPAVEECAAVAVPDDLVTNRIGAHVVTRAPVTERELVRFLSERLPRYMIPERFEFADALPKTSTGKVDRRSLTEAARASSE